MARPRPNLATINHVTTQPPLTIRSSRNSRSSLPPTSQRPAAVAARRRQPPQSATLSTNCTRCKHRISPRTELPANSQSTQIIWCWCGLWEAELTRLESWPQPAIHACIMWRRLNDNYSSSCIAQWRIFLQSRTTVNRHRQCDCYTVARSGGTSSPQSSLPAVPNVYQLPNHQRTVCFMSVPPYLYTLYMYTRLRLKAYDIPPVRIQPTLSLVVIIMSIQMVRTMYLVSYCYWYSKLTDGIKICQGRSVQ